MRWLFAVPFVAALVAAPAASAHTYCVEDPACVTAGGTAQPTLQAALDTADGNGSSFDRIELGSKSTPFDGGRVAVANNVEIIGEGPTRSVLRPRSGDDVTLDVAAGGIRVEHIGIQLPTPVFSTGVRFAPGGTLRDFVVSGSPAGSSMGVRMAGPGEVEDGSISLPIGGANIGLSTQPTGGEIVVDDLDTRAGTGIFASSGFTTISRLRVTASDVGLLGTNDANADVTHAVIRMTGTPIFPDGGAAVVAGSRGIVTGHQLTLVGQGRPDTSGVEAVSGAAGESPRAAIDNSVIANFSSRGHADGAAGGTPEVEFNWVLSSSPVDRTTDAGTISGSDNETAPPRFAGPDDFRLRFDSPGIDAGRPGPLGVGEPTTDLTGAARLVDGNGDGAARRDIGAYEYGRRAPRVSAAAAGPRFFTGRPIVLRAIGEDADGDALTYRWVFSDGGSATGTNVRHTFRTPGRHTAMAVVRDPTGKTASTVLRLTVVDPPVAAPPRDTIAPRFSVRGGRVRATRKGVVSIRVRCAAGEPEPCTGRIALRGRLPGRRSRKLRLFSPRRGRIAAPAGRAVRTRVRLSRTATRALRKRGRLRARMTATVQDAAGNSRTVRKTLTIVRAKR